MYLSCQQEVFFQKINLTLQSLIGGASYSGTSLWLVLVCQFWCALCQFIRFSVPIVWIFCLECCASPYLSLFVNSFLVWNLVCHLVCTSLGLLLKTFLKLKTQGKFTWIGKLFLKTHHVICLLFWQHLSIHQRTTHQHFRDT